MNSTKPGLWNTLIVSILFLNKKNRSNRIEKSAITHSVLPLDHKHPMATVIPARQGAHATLQQGQYIRVINSSGHQVVDLWAFPFTDVPSWMSMAQTRSKLQRVIPVIYDTFVDTRRQPVLSLVMDTSPGVHDMIFPPCDDWRYAEAGAHSHESCGANLRRELAAFTTTLKGEDVKQNGLKELEEKIRVWGWTPEPLNLFMNVPVGSTREGELGRLAVEKPLCKAGDHVVLRAEVDCLVVMSACPNDLMDTNAGDCTDAGFEVLTEHLQKS